MKKKKYIITVLLASLCVLGVILIQKHSNQKIINKIYSHRGASGEETEHSFPAYDLALLYGSHNIEQDLVTSKDGTLYVSHDDNAKRLTGVDRLYSDMTDEEINQLRTSDNNRILRLQDVFDRYKKTTHYVIELKENDKQIDLFNNIIRQNNMEDFVIIQARTLTSLNKIKQTFPKMTTLLLAKDDIEAQNACKADYVDIISLNTKFMTKDIIKIIHEANKQANFWTLNSMADINKATNLGADSYFTNYTAKAIELEKKAHASFFH
ncbi:hydrolase [Vagococcus martis]|uniref:Hydrolase n=1 Tax=Vagococcus martis TaxID=1768210 RepID=A0A1V4DH81_9ENTE|nr:glycerophosphodiester phosphodiesterase [Vagococcus martis]OPF87802.1 hydrolase [Vagococcus martis]